MGTTIQNRSRVERVRSASSAELAQMHSNVTATQLALKQNFRKKWVRQTADLPAPVFFRSWDKMKSPRGHFDRTVRHPIS